MAAFTAGDRVWVPDETDAWLVGSIVSCSDGKIDLRTTKGNKSYVKKDADYAKIEPCGSHIDDNVDNLVDLDELSEGAILHHVRKRFTNQLIYTHVGAILVAVNPFERLDIYGPDDIRKAQAHTQPFPHVFITGAVAYAQLQANQKNQSVLIRYLRYIAHIIK